ncbi:MAG: hypothetical protein WC830_03620 [Burkholderiales bacterium]
MSRPPSEQRDSWNRCRYRPDDPGGHYESYFQRANHPQRPLAFWIRYTVFSPKGRAGDAVGELWAVYFDGERERIAVAKEVFPIRSCAFSQQGLDVRIGDAVLDDAHLAGRAHARGDTLEWDLRYGGTQPPLLLLPPSFYERRLPKAKALVGTPDAVFDGAIAVNGETVHVERWRGSQNHNWGTQHTDSYAWGQVAGFDHAPDVFLECATARLRFGRFWSPALTVLVLRTAEREFRLNGLAQALRARQFRLFLLAHRIAYCRGLGLGAYPCAALGVRRARLRQSAGRHEDLSQHQARRLRAGAGAARAAAAHPDHRASRGVRNSHRPAGPRHRARRLNRRCRGKPRQSLFSGRFTSLDLDPRAPGQYVILTASPRRE